MQKIYYGENGMNKMTDKEKVAFLQILADLGLCRETCLGILAMMNNDINKANEMVDFIEANLNATETELLKKAVEIDDTP